MNPLLEQFLSEARDFLQGIGEKLMQLEQAPDDAELMVGLFRLVHTLKGNSGLFEFPEMTRVLHAGEDLMDAVRNGRVRYSQALADQLLDAMDFVGLLCDEIASDGLIDAARAADSARLAQALRTLIVSQAVADPDAVEDLQSGAAPVPALAAPGPRPIAAGGYSRSGAAGGLQAGTGRRCRSLAELHADCGMLFSGRRSVFCRTPDA
jgi:two-component system chemotaxis sensor kinase CheA